MQIPRPTLLVAEPEPLEGLSTRKLVLETGKFNVITAHSSPEAMVLHELFPKVDGVVLVSGGNVQAEETAEAIKKINSKLCVIMLDARPGAASRVADHTLSSHEPQELLELLRELCGDPRTLDERQQ